MHKIIVSENRLVCITKMMVSWHLSWLMCIHAWAESAGIGIPDLILREQLQMFADDLLVQWLLKQPQDVSHSLGALGSVLHHLRLWNLQPNLAKTAILMHVRGRDRQAALAPFLVLHDQQRYLRIPVQGTHVLIQPPASWEYLGTCLTYLNPQDHMLRHRLRKATQQHLRMAKVWSQTSLSVKERLKVWHSTIGSIMSYRCIRHVVKMPAHVTRASNAELQKQYRLQCPIARLRRLAAHWWYKQWSAYRIHDTGLRMSDSQWISRLSMVCEKHLKCGTVSHAISIMEVARGPSKMFGFSGGVRGTH